MTVLRRWAEPGSQLRGGALELARISTESLAEGNAECNNFKSKVRGSEKRIESWRRGAESNRR
jgi:hypothetical protein